MQLLEIHKNKTFEYYGGACSASFKSSGTWTERNDTLILNSSKTTECLHENEFGVICQTTDQIIKNRDRTTIKGCDPKMDISYEKFINERFFIRNDTLIYVNKRNNPCPELKVEFSAKKKVRKP